MYSMTFDVMSTHSHTQKLSLVMMLMEVSGLLLEIQCNIHIQAPVMKHGMVL